MKKHLLAFVTLVVLVFIGCRSGHSTVVEQTYHVWGNCEKCKATIEKSCALSGVEHAEWDENSKLLKLKLDTAIINPNTVLEAVAKAGYDNEKFFADDYAYNKLPDCCQYERRPSESK